MEPVPYSSVGLLDLEDGASGLLDPDDGASALIFSFTALRDPDDGASALIFSLIGLLDAEDGVAALGNAGNYLRTYTAYLPSRIECLVIFLTVLAWCCHLLGPVFSIFCT
jgi:hypothetical protein